MTVLNRYMMPVLALLFIGLVGCTTPDDNGALPTLMFLPTATQPPTALIAWEAVRAEIAPQQEQAFYFAGIAGEQIRLRIVMDTGQASLRLYDPRGAELVRGTTIEQTLAVSGDYLVLVQADGDAPARYDIGLSYADGQNPALAVTEIPQVVGIPTPTPAYQDLGVFIQSLTAGEDVSGVLSDSEPAHVYLYEATTPNSSITVNMARVDGDIDPLLTLYDESGRAIAIDDNSSGNSNARMLNARLTEVGTYTVQASGKGRTGSYRLILREGEEPLIADPPPLVTATPDTPFATPTLGPATMDTRLVDHAPVIGNIRQVGDIQRFSFEAQAGDTISLAIRPYQNTILQPRFEIYNPEGALIANGNRQNANDTNGLFLWGIVIEQTGVFSVIIAADNGTTGAFTLSYGRGNTATELYQGAIGSNIATDALLNQRGLRHLWEVDLKAGDIITIAASPQDNTLDPVISLSAQDGTLIAQDDESGGNRAAFIQQAVIERSGRYLIRVWDNATNAQGTYTLIWRYINAAPTPTPIPRVATLVSVDDRVEESRYNFYPLSGLAGQNLRIRVQAKAGTNLDPVVVLLDADGREIAQADDSGASLDPDLRVTLPADGVYTVRVNGYLSGGAYTLTIAQSLE